MPPDGKTRCAYRRVYPVRYALSSDPPPPMAAQQQLGEGLNKSLTTAEGGFYQYTLRQLRDGGYVHVFLPNSRQCRTYSFERNAFTRVRYAGATTLENVENAENQSDWLLIPRDEPVIQINFAEIAWPEAYWQEKILADAGYRQQRMQTILLDNAGTQAHTAPAALLGQLVEEFRPKRTGFLDTLREREPTLFRPVTAYKKWEAVKNDVVFAWRHSGVNMGILTKIDHSEPPYQQQAVWDAAPRQTADQKAFACDLQPLLVALYDPIGVGADLATMHWVDLKATEDYMGWYAHPVGIARYLEALADAYKKVKDEYMPVHPVRIRAWWTEWSGRLPQTGWKQMLAWYRQDERTIAAHFKKYCGAWQAWLAHDGPDSLINAFQDYTAVHAKNMEAAFLHCHHGLTMREEGIALARALYLGGNAQEKTKKLLHAVLSAFGTEASETTDEILAAFAGACIHLFNETRQDPWGDLEPVLQERIENSGVQTYTPSGNTFGTYVQDYINSMDKDAVPRESAALQKMLSAPANNVFTIYITFESMRASGINIRKLFDLSEYKGPASKFAARYNNIVAFAVLASSLSKIDPHDKNALLQGITAFQAVGELALSLISNSKSFAIGLAGKTGRVILNGVWKVMLLQQTIVSFGKKDYKYALIQSSYLVTGSIISLLSILPGEIVSIPYWINAIGVTLLLCIAFFTPNALEEWMTGCYWSPQNIAKISHIGQRTFTYIDWNPSKLTIIHQDMTRDAEGLRKLICTPAANFERVQLVNKPGDGRLMLSADDLLEFTIVENLFDPKSGELTVHLKFSAPNFFYTKDSQGKYTFSDLVIPMTDPQYTNLWIKELQYSPANTSVAMATYKIKRSDFYCLFYKYLPKGASMSPDWYPFDLEATVSYKDNTTPHAYTSKNLVLRGEIPPLSIIKNAGDKILINRLRDLNIGFGI